jgi:DNA-binding IscR family transcriptional regulator
MQDTSTRKSNWAYLSNHGHVLVCLARDPNARLRDVAAAVGITERAVQRIVAELEQGGVLEREREGRRNRYTLNRDASLRHDVEETATVGDLLDAVLTPKAPANGNGASITEFARVG